MRIGVKCFKFCFAIIISDKISFQKIKVKRTANSKIKEKINNRLIEKTGIKQYTVEAIIVNSK